MCVFYVVDLQETEHRIIIIICTSLIQYHSRINFKKFITKVLMFYIEF